MPDCCCQGVLPLPQNAAAKRCLDLLMDSALFIFFNVLNCSNIKEVIATVSPENLISLLFKLKALFKSTPYRLGQAIIYGKPNEISFKLC